MLIRSPQISNAGVKKLLVKGAVRRDSLLYLGVINPDYALDSLYKIILASNPLQ